MNPMKLTAVIFVTLGVVVLAYSGITLKTPGRPIDLGPIHIQTTEHHFVPPVAGAIALVAGIVMLVAGNKKD